MNESQRAAHETVRAHCEGDSEAPPLRLLILGTAGSGKSYLLHCLMKLLGPRAKVIAPTGMAALNVNGTTIHFFFRLQVSSPFAELRGDAVTALLEKCDGVQYFICDELSMVGASMLAAIDSRLRQAYPHSATSFFGGASLILFGDFGQLPPVLDAPMYDSESNRQLVQHGYAAYRTFDQCHFLSQSMRQRGDEVFRDCLLRLRDGTVTEADYDLLATRFVGECPPDAESTFLFPTRAQVLECNTDRINRLGEPVAVVEATHSGQGAKKADSNVAGGLERFLSISVGAKIMLRWNMWVDTGLVNGSIGTVKAIAYLSSPGPPALPDFVVCVFPGYTGPAFMAQWPGSVPICPVKRSWAVAGSTLSRMQLPLALAWAMTIHKSQGLTLDSATVHIGDKEGQAGITFVAVSRVRSLQHLRLHPFSMNRLDAISKTRRLKQRKHEEARLKQLSATGADVGSMPT